MTKANVQPPTRTQQPDYWRDELRRSPNLVGRVTDGTGTVAVSSSIEALIVKRLPEDVIRAQGKMALGPLELI